ncbi:MAG: hypothetical protein GY930_06460 [bacterium]|nr:hypothetical protein [bacterium]
MIKPHGQAQMDIQNMQQQSSRTTSVFSILLAFFLGSLGFAFAQPSSIAGKLVWEAEYEAALVKAKTESKIIFLAVNMDDEKGNDRMVKNVYTDRTVQRLAQGTVNLVASIGRHKKSGPCSHLGTITCAEHRAIEGRVNGPILKPDSQGHVIAPQHVWLDSEGKVLISVPYEISAGEMEWCFHEAARKVDPNYAGKESGKSKRPRRWIPGGVFDGESDSGEQPPTRAETLELIQEVRKGILKGGDLVKAYKRIAEADEPEARDQIQQYLKSSGGGGRRGGGKGQAGSAKHIAMVRVIGLGSPQSYWEVLDSLVGNGEDALRNEVAVAMEQLAAPEALKSLTKAYKKEKDEIGRKNLLRAIAACGGQDSAARSLLLKAAKQTRDGVLRRNALIGLGWQVDQNSVRSTIEKVLGEEEQADCIAVVIGMGISRDPIWVDTLKQIADEEGTGGDGSSDDSNPEKADLSLAEVARAALLVHERGEYRALAPALRKVSGDTIPRDRLFKVAKGKGKSRK